MNFKITILGASAALPLSLMGQQNNRPFDLSFQDNKTYQQVGPRSFNFLEGEWLVRLSDGFFNLAGCGGPTGIPMTVPVLPDFIAPNPGCPLGTTASISAGSALDGSNAPGGDGTDDLQGFISVQPIPVPFRFVAPNRVGEVFLNAAPLSRLPRPLPGGWSDDGVTIFYDRVNGPLQQFDFTRYNFTRNYDAGDAELRRMLEEVVPGTYNYSFPRNPVGLTPLQQQVPLPVSVTHRPMLEAFPGRGLIQGNLSFAVTNDERWVDGELLIDPRVGFRFEWFGLSGQNILPGDMTMFSMINPVTEQIVFPVVGDLASDDARVPIVIPTPSTGFNFVPGLFTLGEGPLTARITYMRNFSSTNQSTDNSMRTFEWTVNFVDSFDGFVQQLTSFDPLADDPAMAKDALPADITEGDLDPDADYDGDGFTNFTEFALETSFLNPAESPLIRPRVSTIGRCIYELPKRQNVIPEIQYEVEVAIIDENGVISDYRVIGDNDPDWRIVDGPQFYRVISRNVGSTLPCLFRPKITKLDI